MPIRLRVAVGGMGLVLTGACASSSLVEVAPPNAVADPTVVATAAGATQLYTFAVARLAGVVAGSGASSGVSVVLNSGFMTDELMGVQGGFGRNGDDERNDGTIVTRDGSFFGTNDGNDGFFLGIGLNAIRNEARQARQALVAYAPTAPSAWHARMQAAEGYAIVHLAELFCSGMPLSTVPLLGGGVTLTRGFTTDEMLTQAVALFDSALTLAGDSTRFRYLAAVGKGRALLNMGRFADAAAAVGDVPTDFAYLLELSSSTGTPGSNQIGNQPQKMQVRDNEGQNGLVWSTDPRAAIVTTPSLSGAMPVPAKYSVNGGTVNATAANPNAPVREADGLEARLIEAEAALAVNDASWLGKLNALRSTCVGTAACAPVPGLTAAALSPLADPGSASARLDLVMKERAMWLYLTGHRQGDLRRMGHVYHRDPLTLWPTGLYVNPGFPPLIQPTKTNGAANYVNVYMLRPSSTGGTGAELILNPFYTGCTDLNP